jgi:soluble epoxide hydrolase/lipid-phosphate phosphatase
VKRAGPQYWYRATTENHHYEAEKGLPSGRSRVDMPILFIGYTKDPVYLVEMTRIPESQGLLPCLTVKELDCGCWCMREKPTEVEGMFRGWLKSF